MKIVILDGHTLNPDDLSWDKFRTLGEVEVYPRSTPEEVLERAADAEAILINKIKMRESVIDQLPKLQYVGICATGVDNVDIEAANQRNIAVTNVPAYSTPSVAQHTFALLLELTNRVGLHHKSVMDLEWVRSKDFSYFKSPLIELKDKVFGIIGYGAIGQEVEKIAAAFGMEVLIYSSYAKSAKHGKIVSLDELLNASDIISLHTALREDTQNLINKSTITKMKKGVMLINTSRGPIINENDMAVALKSGHIGGAGLDVLSKEPPQADNPLLDAPNCVITPHISWVSFEARQRLINVLFDNLSAFLEGKELNRIK